MALFYLLSLHANDNLMRLSGRASETSVARGGAASAAQVDVVDLPSHGSGGERGGEEREVIFVCHDKRYMRRRSHDGADEL